MTFWPRLAGETGATAGRADPRELRGPGDLRLAAAARRAAGPTTTSSTRGVQTRMRIEMRTLVERASRWLVTNRRPPLDSQGTVDFFAEPVQEVMAQLPDLMTGRELDGVPRAARRPGRAGRARGPRHPGRRARPAYMLLGIVEIATRDEPRPGRGRPGALRARRAARAAGAGAADPRAAARGPLADDGPRRALRDDLHAVHSQLTAQVLRGHRRPTTRPRPGSPPGRTATRSWSAGPAATLEEICADDDGRPGPDVGRAARRPRPARRPR